MTPSLVQDSPPCRVLVCDDQDELRQAIGRVLAATPRFEVVAEAANGAGCVEQVRLSRPHMLILDVNMPGGGPRVPRAVKALDPDVYILVYSGRKDEQMQQDMLSAGADEYLVKTGRLQPLLKALDEASKMCSCGGN